LVQHWNLVQRHVRKLLHPKLAPQRSSGLLSLADVKTYLDEIARGGHPTRLIGFTGGEPFMNPAFPTILEETLSRGEDAERGTVRMH
jgi:hypothetical protein